MTRDIDLEHGLSDVLWPNSLPCNQTDPTGTGKVACGCDGSSYFPVQIKPESQQTGSCNGPIEVKHPKDRIVVACQDCSGPDRMACLDGKVTSCKDHLDNVHEIHNEMRKQIIYSKPQEKVEQVAAHSQESGSHAMMVGVVVIVAMLAFIYLYKGKKQ